METLTVHLDLCVSAALDAVKEGVELPWSTASTAQSSSTDDTTSIQATTSKEDTTITSSSQDASSTDPTTEETLTTLDEPSSQSATIDPAPASIRILQPHHFEKALKEITPSSSDALSGSVRKWNEEFGEGRKDKKNLQVWGKGTFGFIEKLKPVEPSS